MNFEQWLSDRDKIKYYETSAGHIRELYGRMYTRETGKNLTLNDCFNIIYKHRLHTLFRERLPKNNWMTRLKTEKFERWPDIVMPITLLETK